MLVIKKDGSRQMFDSEKIKKGVIKACEKRPVPIKNIEELANNIEKKIFNSLKQEITTNEIGEMVMQGLKDMDDVAYVRFASVYRQFKDLNTFVEELNKMLAERK
jgi:transcriptional repressor NrdR